jgi:hypothetical protein
MIGNLQKQETLEDQADFLVIGAGTVGLPTSILLARKTGKRVVCLESGDYHQDGWPISCQPPMTGPRFDCFSKLFRALVGACPGLDAVGRGCTA